MRKTNWTIPIRCALAASLLAIATCSALWAQEKNKQPPALEGTWVVESVEFSGTPVPGLKGAELALLSDGKKIFTQPGGTVEKGTYVVDATKTPQQIDSTTEGKDGTQRGIVALDGDTLRMCLATQRSRPTEFATKESDGLLLIVLKRATSKSKPASDAQTPSRESPRPTGPRKFRMGFTGLVYDTTPAAVAASRKFVRDHGDIIAHHIEGVPWAEALSDDPFPKALLDDWKGKKSATPPNGKVYLAISPGRGDLKLHDKAGPLPRELRGKAYDDPLVMKAYLAYCRRAIEFFEPDYLCIGIEVNEIHRDPGPSKWNAYVALHEHIYRELKKDRKDLPIFASLTLHTTFQHRGGMLEEFKKLMPYNDLVGVSYYPFFVPENSRLSALDWLTDEFGQFQKPYAMVETNDSAERLPLPQLKVVLDGTPEKQAAYYRKLLALAHEREFAFVISFVHQDYDPLWEKIAATSPELFKAWRDCGLLDENGNRRPAYHVWNEHFTQKLDVR
jgi:uncharacterized protein (TIGR03067 family)